MKKCAVPQSGYTCYPEQNPGRMFPIRAADIAKESIFVRSRSASAGGREVTRPYVRDTGVCSVPLPPQRQLTAAPVNYDNGQKFSNSSYDLLGNSSRRAPMGVATCLTGGTALATPTVREALQCVPDFPKPTPTPPRMGITRPPRLPWETRRVQSANLSSPSRNKLLQQRPDIPNFAMQKKDIPEIEPTRAEGVVGQHSVAHAYTQCPSPPDAPKKTISSILDSSTEAEVSDPLPPRSHSPKPSGPISAWTKEPEARRSACASKRACFRENVDVFYYDTDEKPTETESRDFEKLKDDDSVTSDDTTTDDLSSDGGGSAPPQSSSPPLSSPSRQPKPFVTATSHKNNYSKGNVVVARNLCFKQEIELVPNAEDAHESLIRRELRRLAVVVQIEETCIKQLTSVKAMSGGRTIIVVTHRPAGLEATTPGGATNRIYGHNQGSAPSMVLVQHVDKLRLPVMIDPYSVKAHIHKDWTLKIEAPVREWMDCPSAVLRCRLPLTAHAGVAL